MTQSIVALVGISGVGKSTLLRELARELTFQHLQASVLIKAERDVIDIPATSIDDLRSTNIGDNQVLLVSGFSRARDPSASFVILDGHAVIDTPSGLISISPQVFGMLGIQQFIFLADNPEAIALRRRSDCSRDRPLRTPLELEQHQTSALLNTFAAAQLLSVPIMVCFPSNLGGIRRLLIDAGSAEVTAT